MKLTRTTKDRPDFPTPEAQQPTCYDTRNPMCPWLAAASEPDDTEDREFARTWAALRQDGVNVAALDAEELSEHNARKLRARLKGKP